jgi:tRNA(Ile)-lysidine synthase
MALLHLLLELNRSAGWQLRLHVAHLNHGLRGEEANADAAFVQAACDSLALPCTIDQRDVRAGAAAEGLSIEEMSRRERYAFFERVCLQSGMRTVALGHHADDNAETILHRVLRGTGLRGLAGIPRSRPLGPGSEIRVVRPLLSFTKAELRTYLVDAGIAFREDRTNVSNEPMRNRIRNLILPQIEAQVNPQVRDALNRLGLQARWLDEFLQETVHRTFETLVISRTDRSLAMNAEAVLRKSRIVQTELIRMAYASLGLGEQDLSFGHLNAVLEILSDPASGKQIQLPGGLVVEKRYGQLLFAIPSSEPREAMANEIAVHCPGRTVLPVRRLEIEASIQGVNGNDIQRLRRQATRMEEFLDMDAVHGPLIVRARRPGDRFTPLGAPGSKKLADFLADEKVDPKSRETVAVLCDQLGPIWVIGHRIDDRAKLTELTRRVLHLRAKQLET